MGTPQDHKWEWNIGPRNDIHGLYIYEIKPHVSRRRGKIQHGLNSKAFIVEISNFAENDYTLMKSSSYSSMMR